jgi:hypothetical protein
LAPKFTAYILLPTHIDSVQGKRPSEWSLLSNPKIFIFLWAITSRPCTRSFATIFLFMETLQFGPPSHIMVSGAADLAGQWVTNPSLWSLFNRHHRTPFPGFDAVVWRLHFEKQVCLSE